MSAAASPSPNGSRRRPRDGPNRPRYGEFTKEEVRPNRVYHDYDFEGVQFIWTEDLELANTILFRYRAEKPGR